MPEYGENPGRLFAVGSRLGAFGVAMTGSAIGAFFGQENPQLGVAVATTAAGLLGNLSSDFLTSSVEAWRAVPGRNFYQEDCLRQAMQRSLAELRVEEYGERWFDPWHAHLGRDSQEHLANLFHTLEARDARELALHPDNWWEHAERSLEVWAAAGRNTLTVHPLPVELGVLLRKELPRLVDAHFRHAVQNSPQAAIGVTLDYLQRILSILEANPPAPPKPALDLARRYRRVPTAADPLLAARGKFFGREAELDRIRAFLQPGAGLHNALPILVIDGPAGMGKTELCKAALREYLASENAHAVYFVDCEGVATRPGVVERLGLAWEAKAEGDDETRERVVLSRIYAEPAVLYLDNLEDPLADETVPALLTRLVEHPGLRVLASSRQEVDGDARNVQLEPLALDRAVDMFLYQWNQSDDGADLPDSPELRDFVDRDLVRHPLSIRLVASHARDLRTLERLRKAWRERRSALEAQRGGRERLTNLEVSVALSWERVREMRPSALWLWAMMPVFPEGMSEEAFAKVAGAAGLEDEDRVVLRRMNVVAEDRKTGRVSALPFVRAFAERRVRSGAEGCGASEVEGWAWEWFWPLVHEADSVDTGAIVRSGALGRVRVEFLNVVAFAAWLADTGGESAWDRLEQIINGLRNRFSNDFPIQSDSFLAAMRSRVSAALSPPAQLRAVLAQSSGDVARMRARYEEAGEHYGVALAIYRDIGNRFGEANCIRGLGDVALRRARNEEAGEHYGVALAIFRDIGNRLGEANCIKGLGDVALSRDRYEEAVEHYGVALPIYRDIGVRLGEANCIKSLGDVALSRDRYEEAGEHYGVALPIYSDIGDRMGEANCIQSLGDVALRRARDEEAGEHYGVALAIFRDIGDRLGEAGCRQSQGDVALSRGRNEEAGEHYGVALAIYRDIGDRLGEAGCKLQFGGLRLATGRHLEARDLLTSSAELYAEIGVPEWEKVARDLLEGIDPPQESAQAAGAD